MTPFHTAQHIYETEPCARPFLEDLHHHFQHGWVYSSPGAFAMCRTVSHTWPEAWLREPWRTDAEGDCWMFWLLAGDLFEAMAKLPHPLPWMAFERQNVMRVLPMDRAWRLLGRDSRPAQRSRER